MSLFDERVEAGARVLRERMFPGVDLPLGDSAWVGHAREVLLAADAVVKRVDEAGNEHQKCLGCGRYADECCLTLDERMARARAKGVEFVKEDDAVVTEEMIAETILKALVFTNENSKPWADGLARDIAALFRGGAK